MRPVLELLAIALLAAGCATGGSVRELGSRERDLIAAARERVQKNEGPMRDATATLGNLGADYAEKEFQLELALAKAKWLDAMQAPWASPDEESRETQRAMVLYHLYAVEMAEQKVLEARARQRREAAQEVFTAYQRLGALLESASKNMETVLQYLNQPKSARIAAFAQQFRGEVSAFRQSLQESENPRLRALAESVARYEEQAVKAHEQAQRALDAVIKARGD